MKKKSFIITLSDEESSFGNEGEEYGRALISCIVKEEQRGIECAYDHRAFKLS